jgi:hypothetical protein
MRIWPFKYASAGNLPELLPEPGYLSPLLHMIEKYTPCLSLSYAQQDGLVPLSDVPNLSLDVA